MSPLCLHYLGMVLSTGTSSLPIVAWFPFVALCPIFAARARAHTHTHTHTHACTHAHARTHAMHTCRHGVVHRDLKPANLVMRSGGAGAASTLADTSSSGSGASASRASGAAPTAASSTGAPLQSAQWVLVDFGNAVTLPQPLQSNTGEGKQQQQQQAASSSGAHSLIAQHHRHPQQSHQWQAAHVFQTLAYCPPEELLGYEPSSPQSHTFQPTRPHSPHSPHSSSSTSQSSHNPPGVEQSGSHSSSSSSSSDGCMQGGWSVSSSSSGSSANDSTTTTTAAATQGYPPWAHPGNDMWSLGCVAYEAATGAKLFDAARARSLLLLHEQKREDSNESESVSLWKGSRRSRSSYAHGLSVGQLEDDEIQLWLMAHVLGALPEQVCDCVCVGGGGTR